MANDEQACYVYIQLRGTMETVPCASLQVRAIGAGAFEGTFTYGKRYLERPEVVALDPFHLPLSTRPQKFTKLKGIPGAVRDASSDAWGRRVIQTKLQRPEADIQEVEYLLNGPDDGAGNLSFGRTATPPAPRRPLNRTHQLPALIEAAEKLEEGRTASTGGTRGTRTRHEHDARPKVVRGWREFFTERGVEQRSIEMLGQAMLPPSFFRDTPPDAV